MKIVVRVRESEFTQEVGKGLQHFRWLATVAARRYAEAYAPAHNVHEFIPSNVTDERLRVLFPDDQLADHVKDGSVVIVDVVGPGEGLHGSAGSKREPTMWEKYAYTPMEEWRAVKFVFDVEGASEDDDPEVKTYGNFNRWGAPIPLRREGRTTRFTLDTVFPPGAEVCFKFIVNGQEYLSDSYEQVADDEGARMNCFYVEHPSVTEDGLSRGGAGAGHGGDSCGEGFGEWGAHGAGICGRDSAADFRRDKSAGSEGDVRVVSAKVVGAFEPVRTMTEELRTQLFEHDWGKMQFADVVRTRVDRNAIKEVLHNYYDALCKTFQYFSSHGSGDITFMSVMEWLHFCHVCKLPGTDCSTARLDRIFRRVNIEEEFDEDFIEANPKEYRNAMRIVPDPFNPNNQFIRGEFMEALVRAALVKLRGMPPAVATQTLIEQHVVMYALKVSEDGIRERLLTPAVQQVYRRYARRLHSLFLETAKLDQSDQDDTTINLREFELLLNKHSLFDRDLSRRAAFSAFALSQDASLSSSDDYEMVYGEFLEVLGRLAALKFGGKQERQPASGDGAGANAGAAAAPSKTEGAAAPADADSSGDKLAGHLESLMQIVFVDDE